MVLGHVTDRGRGSGKGRKGMHTPQGDDLQRSVLVAINPCPQSQGS